jgi:hypothetical protein
MNNFPKLVLGGSVNQVPLHGRMSGLLRRICLFVLLTLSIGSLSAQVAELGQSLQQLSASGNPEDQALAAELNNLIYELTPTAFVNGGALTLPEDGVAPVRLNVNAQDLGSVDFADGALSALQLIRIRIEDSAGLSANYDASQFPAGAHVLMVSEVEVNAEDLSALFGNSLNRTVYYVISVPR